MSRLKAISWPFWLVLAVIKVGLYDMFNALFFSISCFVPVCDQISHRQVNPIILDFEAGLAGMTASNAYNIGKPLFSNWHTDPEIHILVGC